MKAVLHLIFRSFLSHLISKTVHPLSRCKLVFPRKADGATVRVILTGTLVADDILKVATSELQIIPMDGKMFDAFGHRFPKGYEPKIAIIIADTQFGGMKKQKES